MGKASFWWFLLAFIVIGLIDLGLNLVSFIPVFGDLAETASELFLEIGTVLLFIIYHNITG